MNLFTRDSRGFALVATLAILAIVSILVAAFATTMRTERLAAQNFSERERAQAIAQGLLNRILADHAAPVAVANKPLKPYAVDPTTKLPTKPTDDAYNAAVPTLGIYRMEPMAGLSSANHLVRISQPLAGKGEDAYSPEEWAWARQKVRADDPDTLIRSKVFTPHNSEGVPISPKWVDYLEAKPSGEPGTVVRAGEVAYCIWDDSGKIDLNLAGADGYQQNGSVDSNRINGIAPHKLGFEALAIKPEEFLAQLNGRDKERQRSNFGLRRIIPTRDTVNKTKNSTGDDRWFFSVEEMLARNLIAPENALEVTSSSRDFDVRPEWDGDRSPKNAEKFLRSYINNPNLFALFTHPNAGSHLVRATLNETQLRSVLASNGLPATDENWMQVMRLLAALRLSLPPFINLASPALPAALPMNQWTDDDVWGIALNIMQATAPASDQNLHAYNRKSFGVSPFNDPNVRLGVRVGPYITETALQAERISPTQVRLKQYYEVWNPYEVPLLKPDGKTPIKYFFGNWTGGQWETSHTTPTGGIYPHAQRWELPGVMTIGTAAPKVVNPPAPREFVIISPPARIVNWSVNETRNLEVRTRPYIQNQDYWGTLITGGGAGVEESSSYAITIGPFYSAGGGDPAYNLIHTFAAAKLNRKDPANPAGNTYTPVWHSFQIDDPRMGPFSRYLANFRTSVNPPELPAGQNFNYSWKAYPEKHSLFGFLKDPKIPEAEKFVSPYGDGFNENFGSNWPTGFDFDRAMATFALPRRPFLNVGELGTVFANRPWRTLSFASTTVPTDSTLLAGSKVQNYPTALLDYLTTIGSTSDRTVLNYKVAAGSPPSSLVTPNLKEREQDKIWLFESLDTKLLPNGNLRPIRGKINLNSASRDSIRRLLSAPYRVVRSRGLLNTAAVNPKPITTAVDSDLEVTVSAADADMIAAEIVGDSVAKVNSIRPIRSMADLGKLTAIRKLHTKYPDPVVDAMIGRLAQFGTVRQQIYTVDIIARSLNRKVEERRLDNPTIPPVVTAEVRFLARIYFDTFSRRGFVESIEYR